MTPQLPRRIDWHRLGATISLMLLPLGAPLWDAYLRATGNTHEVEAGRLYRSRQLNDGRLAALIAAKGIRTVINLRGAAPHEEWYRRERAAVSSGGAVLVDLRLPDRVEPAPDVIERLVEMMQTAEAPVLLHCKAGADRTGLAAALYKLVVAGSTADEAARELSFAYGHFPWLGSRTSAMDRAFWNYARDHRQR